MRDPIHEQIPYARYLKYVVFFLPLGTEVWHSFNYGSVHIAMLSTEHDMLPGSDQYNWLQDDLESVDRSVTPWVIVGGHR